MPEPTRNEYRPERVSPPGETLQELLTERGMSQAELAERMGRPKKTINEIINAKTAITPETAIQLERVLGVPASFWNRLERNYQEFLAAEAEQEQLAQHLGWPRNFPLSQMVQRGWMREPSDRADEVRSMLTFFGVSSIDQWQAMYREQLTAFRLPRTYKPDVYALTAWLRRGEQEAQMIECKPYEASGFKRALRDARQLTLEADWDLFAPRLRELGSKYGVAILFVQELPKSRACGATRWLSPIKALIQLSLRYRTNDHLWFTFFHEAAHILLHGKREAFVEVMGASSGSHDREEEANRYAANCLISERELGSFLEYGDFSASAVKDFGLAIGVAPGIVVGRLQHDNHIGHNQLNELKIRYEWV